jgi:exosortase A-associated hydrolase 2
LLKGHFVPCRSGGLFVCQYGTQNTSGTILLLPSFFEEMNLCRAVVAKQAQFLVSQGYVVYALDYFGTGDSAGHIRDATSHIWVEDIEDVATWLAKNGAQSLKVWAVRAGALLAFSALQNIQRKIACNHLLLWKPVLKGKAFMSQFLRLKQMNAMLNGDHKIDCRQQLLTDGVIEIAGYEISNKLFESLEGLQFPKELADSTQVGWMELASKGVSPAIQNVVKIWPANRTKISCHEGPAFWQIPEVFEQPELHGMTAQMLGGN